MDSCGCTARIATMTTLQSQLAVSASSTGVARIGAVTRFQRSSTSALRNHLHCPSRQHLDGIRIPSPSQHRSVWKHGGGYRSIVAQREHQSRSSPIARTFVARQNGGMPPADGVPLPLENAKASGKGAGTSPAHIFAGIVLAIGFGLLRFSKPAYAENVAVAPPTVTATLNEKGEVEVRDSDPSDVKLDDGTGAKDSSAQQDQAGDSAEEGDDDIGPLFGEDADMTTDHAEVILTSYLDSHPEDRKAMQALLFLRLKKGEVDAAVAVLTKLIELEPDNLEWKYIKAQADEFADNLLEARQGYEDIIRVKPTSARAWQGLIVLMHKAGEDEPAELMLMEAIRRAVEGGKPKDVTNLRMLLGQLYTIQGNLEKAMDQYSIVSKEDATDYRPYLCQGLVYSLMGEEQEAEKYLRRYRQLCPKDFPQRGFLDELLLNAKGESQKLSKQAKEEEELRAKGKKLPKKMRQPLASGSLPSKTDDKTAR